MVVSHLKRTGSCGRSISSNAVARHNAEAAAKETLLKSEWLICGACALERTKSLAELVMKPIGIATVGRLVQERHYGVKASRERDRTSSV
jgi:hypothetical protein